ncbi:YitT family protein [Adhaeribacter sp. BT258]|uniref:YitT family protein n=1 Tax=Adhaeribacter terrigena TaxID=2793070 RepID=A0ABS1BX84_9BACT|nr:YitT family protein [Adhaeribacter terrigena]MBK0401511.1 YitT family protein [Adhaeribacter terrigena]
MLLKTQTHIKDFLLIVAGIISATFGLEGFLLSSHFIDGGVTGISMLLASISGYGLPILIAVLNLPFILLGYRHLGKGFAVKSTFAILGLSIALATVHFPEMTHDKLLTAVFGGFFIGLGIGLAMRGGAVLDGTEIAALLISKKSPLLKVSDVILILNVVIFTSAAFFLGLDVALYSILTYFAASKMIDFVVQGIEEYTGITIISEQSELIRQAITENLGRGVTIYKGKRGFGARGDRNLEMDIVFTVVTRLEIPALRLEIEQIDPKAFIIQQSINDTTGGMVKRRALH